MRLEPESKFVKFTEHGQSIRGRILEPVEETFQGKRLTRHQIEVEHGVVKTLPACAYLVGALNAGIRRYGAGNFSVNIVYTHDLPTRKGNPQKIFGVEVLDGQSEVRDPDLFERMVPNEPV